MRNFGINTRIRERGKTKERGRNYRILQFGGDRSLYDPKDNVKM